jgi:uncharacterized membrane protein YphA (DoxX/SURF4 family)
LVLRIAVGLTGAIQGALILADHGRFTLESWTVGLLLMVSGLLVLIGFLTPIASIVQAVVAISFGLSWLSAPRAGVLLPPLAILFLAAMAAALALLGPGWVSVDSRLFGRREIIIPRSRRPAS